jgi:hypothetical protein
MGAVEGDLGRRPRLHLGREPPLPDAGRRRVHHRGEAPLWLRRGQGRHVKARTVQDRPDNLQVKEVRLGDGSDRFIICFNPDQAERDAAIRARLTAQLEELIAGTDGLTAAERAKREGSLAGRPGLKRFLRVTPAGLLRVDKAKIKTEENLDGKYLLRSSDLHLSAEDIALGYKQLLEVERGWRDMNRSSTCAPSTTAARTGSAPTSSCAGSRSC